ncbi:hypothetical protein ACOTCG_28015 [Achromobacter xylosoxidans]
MIIKLRPIRWDADLSVVKLGDALDINGEVFDFSQLLEGQALPFGAVDSEFVVGDVTRQEGQLVIPLLAPHGAGSSEAARFPADITDPPDGPVELPR